MGGRLRTELLIGAFLVAALIMVAALGFVAPPLEARLETERLEAVERLAQAARLAVEAEGLDPATAPGLARRLGTELGARVTLYDAGGRPIGDTTLQAEEVVRLESLAERPEVRAVLSGEPVAVERRYSATTKQRMLYIAVPAAPARRLAQNGRLEDG